MPGACQTRAFRDCCSSAFPMKRLFSASLLLSTVLLPSCATEEHGMRAGIQQPIERGEVLGFLGPNGAGKSTTMRMITGFIPPTEGEITIGDHDMLENPIAAKRLIGYLPENAPSYADMSVHGFLSFTAELRGLSGDANRKAVNRVIEMCFLEPVTHQSVETLSKGYRHRTGFAQSI